MTTTTVKTPADGTYLFSKYTLRNERYTFGGDTLAQGEGYSLSDEPADVFDVIANYTPDKYSGGKVLYRAWDVYEDDEGKRFSVETYHEDEVA